MDPLSLVAALAACAGLAHETYKKCRDCSGDYEHLRSLVLAMETTLRDLRDLVDEHQLIGHSEEECWDRVKDCEDVLKALKSSVDRHSQITEGRSKRIRAWNGIQWDPEAIQRLKDRLTTSLTLVNMFYSKLIASAQIRIEKALSRLSTQIREHRRDNQSVSRLTATDSETDDSEAWQNVLADLEETGLDGKTAEANKQFIIDYLFNNMPSFLPDETIREHQTVEEEPIPPPNSPPPLLISSPRERLSTSLESTSQSVESPSSQRPISMTSNVAFFESSTSLDQVSMYQRLLEPFGKTGALEDERVRRGENTFKDDLNCAREFWRRKNWYEVKKYLLRILVAAQLPTHRRLDIKARTAVFLDGVAHSNSGHLEMAKSILLSVLIPVEALPASPLSYDFPLPMYDDGQIAAATWLGDVCMKTYRPENAAFAWALAYDAVLRKAQDRDRPARSHETQGHSPPNSVPSPPSPPPKFRPIRAGGRDISPHHVELQTRVILHRLAYYNRRTSNLYSLIESLESNYDLDYDESVFSNAKLMSREQMLRIARLAKNAAERADDSLLSDGAGPRGSHVRGRSSSQLQQSALHSSVEGASSNSSIASPVSPAEDFLVSPIKSPGWPLEWDTNFHLDSALNLFDWFFNTPELSGEGVMYNLKMTNSEHIRNHPAIFVDDFEDKDSDRFIKTLRRLIKSLGFESREQPGSFKCRNKANSWSRFPSIAYFELQIYSYSVRFSLHRKRLAASICNILHWNNLLEQNSFDHEDTQNMLEEMRRKMKIYEAENRGRLLPVTLSDVAGAGT